MINEHSNTSAIRAREDAERATRIARSPTLMRLMETALAASPSFRQAVLTGQPGNLMGLGVAGDHVAQASAAGVRCLGLEPASSQPASKTASDVTSDPDVARALVLRAAHVALDRQQLRQDLPRNDKPTGRSYDA